MAGRAGKKRQESAAEKKKSTSVYHEKIPICRTQHIRRPNHVAHCTVHGNTAHSPICREKAQHALDKSMLLICTHLTTANTPTSITACILHCKALIHFSFLLLSRSSVLALAPTYTAGLVDSEERKPCPHHGRPLNSLDSASEPAYVIITRHESINMPLLLEGELPAPHRFPRRVYFQYHRLPLLIFTNPRLIPHYFLPSRFC